ncbi:hypothetical protein [Mucilaginibacter sp. SP1R1]|uniref:hypothetical protein n=1 Tax=Mucilaginibacter sp. SP1R1 TaxID=2723091 RepID=UPI001617BBA2|nr:hypothetical protein [Mucilaginibacter sp. SP1R1]MBB6147648.1 hypothetical protein [Mucilaginibacter sp. SP1R1]
MQNIAKVRKGYVLPMSRLVLSYTLQIIEDAFHPQPLYGLNSSAAYQSSGSSPYLNRPAV